MFKWTNIAPCLVSGPCVSFSCGPLETLKWRKFNEFIRFALLPGPRNVFKFRTRPERVKSLLTTGLARSLYFCVPAPRPLHGAAVASRVFVRTGFPLNFVYAVLRGVRHRWEKTCRSQLPTAEFWWSSCFISLFKYKFLLLPVWWMYINEKFIYTHVTYQKQKLLILSQSSAHHVKLRVKWPSKN